MAGLITLDSTKTNSQVQCPKWPRYEWCKSYSYDIKECKKLFAKMGLNLKLKLEQSYITTKEETSQRPYTYANDNIKQLF